MYQCFIKKNPLLRMSADNHMIEEAKRKELSLSCIVSVCRFEVYKRSLTEEYNTTLRDVLVQDKKVTKCHLLTRT